MATIINYGGQNYNPPMVQAIPSRNWMSGVVSLTTNSTIDIMHADLIVIFRGGPVTTGAVEPDIPAAALNGRLDINCNQSGINLSLQEDLIDNAMHDLYPAPIICGNGLTTIFFAVNGFNFRARAARIANATTTVTFACSFIGY